MKYWRQFVVFVGLGVFFFGFLAGLTYVLSNYRETIGLLIVGVFVSGFLYIIWGVAGSIIGESR